MEDVERGRGREVDKEKNARLWKDKKGGQNVEMQTDGVLRSSLVSQPTKATRREATRSPSAWQGVARTLDHYRHCPLMDIYECTNQRHYYRASMQSESII